MAATCNGARARFHLVPTSIFIWYRPGLSSGTDHYWPVLRLCSRPRLAPTPTARCSSVLWRLPWPRSRGCPCPMPAGCRSGSRAAEASDGSLSPLRSSAAQRTVAIVTAALGGYRIPEDRIIDAVRM